ncbi:holo-ACP synthase [Candidatus Odyssella thessalonicensis]|uniref:holo-ACP synthase n=1 Tax=Candidatus Odyssella thessalonicensis TaxID=84647 RepID=UPI000225B750|nr:holo-ACP synthase [Candidatus Odyssella thessalonicensis]
MIIGIGSDLIDIRRIEAVIKRQGQKFLNRVFTAYEQERSQLRAHSTASYAKMFAAKEALIKALGTGLAKGVTWHNIEVRREPWSPPTLILSGMAKHHFQSRIPSGLTGRIHLSMTDEPPYAQAFVVLSAE